MFEIYISPNKPILGWHFVSNRLIDGSLIPADNEMLVHEGKIELSRSGLHGSHFIMDAFYRAPFDTLHICRAEFSGHVILGSGQLVASHRKYQWRVDAKQILQKFVTQCAKCSTFVGHAKCNASVF